jgi:hypothetical protein
MDRDMIMAVLSTKEEERLTSLTLKRPFLSGYTKANDNLAFFLLAAGATSLTCKRNTIDYEP